MSRSSRDGTSGGGGDSCMQLQRSEKTTRAAWQGGTIESVSICGRLLRVLVVDDNRDAADSMGMLVEMWGHDVRVVYDGEAALRMASTYQADVLLLDIGLPGMDGFEAARELRRHPRLKDVLLVAISGYPDEAHRQLGEAAGFDHYLVKPVEPSTVEELLLLAAGRLASSPDDALLISRKGSLPGADDEVTLVTSDGDWQVRRLPDRLPQPGQRRPDPRSHERQLVSVPQ